jgi:hypothetical protein
MITIALPSGAVAAFSTVLLCLPAGASAQQLIASCGAEFQNGSTRIAFTIGEPVIATHLAASVVTTQGFHQPDDDFSTHVVQVLDPAVEVIAFPNPARDEVTVMVTGAIDPIALIVVDATGRSVLRADPVSHRGTIDVRPLSSGCYFILASSNEQPLATIQLTITR